MAKRKILMMMVTVVGMAFGLLMYTSVGWSKLRLSSGADIQADAKVVRMIEAAFERAEEAINAGDVDALMKLYSEDYRYKNLTKKDMRNLWKDFFAKYHRVSTSHSFSRIVVKPGTPPTAEIMCTGSIWGTSNKSDQRVNLASWLGDIHLLMYEDGAWRIHGQGKKSPETSEFGGAPPPLF